MKLNSAISLALATLATSSPIKLAPRAANLKSNTQNDLVNGVCKPVTMIFAMGTTEQGNVGSLTGPPVFQAVASAVGADNLAVQGVDYPADIPGFLAGGDAKGSALMAKLVQQAMTQCPDTKVVMSGYSQGGQLVHNAAQQLPAAVSSKVAAAVIFGDPDNGKAVTGVSAAKTLVVCHATDNICQGGSTILAAHLTYGSQNADDAAKFIQQATA